MSETDPYSVHRTDTELRIERDFDAPRPLVWRALTDPDRVAGWWGPSGFSLTTESHDLRPGGAWKFTMHGPDGRDYPNHINFLTVDEPAALAYKHIGDENNEPLHFETVITLEAISDSRTRVALAMNFASPEAMARVITNYNALEGAKQTLARLAETLNRAERPEPPLVIRRVLDAPRELVWDAWTNANHLLNWFRPKAWALSTCDLDFREGGSFHYCMSAEGMPDMWGLWDIQRIDRPNTLEFVVSFSDEHRAVVRAPFAEHWPLHVHCRVTIEHHAGIGAGTLLTLQSEPINATDEERAAFAAGVGSMQQGWGQTLDNLVEHLAAHHAN